MSKKPGACVKLREAAETLGVSPNTLRNWDRSGKLKAVRHPVNRYRMYRLDDITRMAQETGQLYLPSIERGVASKVRTPERGLQQGGNRGAERAFGGRDPRTFRSLFRQLSRAFRDSRGGGLLERFEEISKLLFCKLLDERDAESGQGTVFRTQNGASTDSVYGRIANVYKRACEQYPSVFEAQRAQLSSDREAITKGVEILRDIDLSETSGDVKGAAYEELIRDTFEKNENQQFFTPRVLVEFMVEVTDPGPDMVVCDPACGSGGFLIAALQHVFLKIQQGEGNPSSKEASRKVFKSQNLIGAEIDSRMAWIAQMNLLMHGDGEGKVVCLPGGGSLAYSEASRAALPEGKFDVILTNPPFGSDFSDVAELARYRTGKDRTSRRRGVLFVERCLGLLMPGGRLGIILDDSVLSGSANQDVRRLVFKDSIVEAVISLPEVAFMPYASAKASILFLRKKELSHSSPPQGGVFMATVENVGNRPNGDPLYADERDENGRLQLLNDLPKVLVAWRHYKKSGEADLSRVCPTAFVCRSESFYDEASHLRNDRLDVLFYHPSRELAQRTLSRCVYPAPRLVELVAERYVSTVPSVTQPDESCRYLGLASITARTGEYVIDELRGDRIKSAARVFRGGDIVFAKLRPELRKCAFIRDDEEEGYASSECVILRGLDRLPGDPDLNDLLVGRTGTAHQVDSEYLAYMLRSDIVYGQLVFQITGVGRPRVPKSAILNVRIPLPPIEVQKQLLATFRKSWQRYLTCRRRSQDALREAEESLESAYQFVQANLCPPE